MFKANNGQDAIALQNQIFLICTRSVYAWDGWVETLVELKKIRQTKL